MSLGTKHNLPKRIFRVGEYDPEHSSPMSLAIVPEPSDFRPIQLGRSPWPSNDDLDEIRQDARRQGLEQGRLEAREEWRRERAQQRQAFSSLLEGLAKPYQDLNQELALELAEMALEIGAALFGRALQSEPEQVAAIVTEAVALLPRGEGAVRVILHPDDLALCSELLQEDPPLLFQADEEMRRGGCLVRRGFSEVDASVAGRLRRLVDNLHQDTPSIQVQDAATKIGR